MVIHMRGLLCSEALEGRLARLVAAEKSPKSVLGDSSRECSYVSPCDRDEAAHMLGQLTRSLECYPETFARAVSILDAFLYVMKVKVKFLSCLAVTCFSIAAKLEEDAEHVPTVEQLLCESGCSCSQRDVQRMELLVMQKLEFDLVRISPLEFLQLFHTLATINQMLQLPPGLTPSRHLNLVTEKLKVLMCSSVYMKFKPSVLALSVLTCELKSIGCDWLTVLVMLQDKAQVKGTELSICWEHVAGSTSS